MHEGNGTVAWKRSLPGHTWSSPIVVGDFVYVSVDKTIHAIRWRER